MLARPRVAVVGAAAARLPGDPGKGMLRPRPCWQRGSEPPGPQLELAGGGTGAGRSIRRGCAGSRRLHRGWLQLWGYRQAFRGEQSPCLPLPAASSA